MSKGWIAFGIVVGVILISFLSISGTYNGLVTKDEVVANSWANVQTAYERRADLIPNLVETVKGYSKMEQETQTSIATLRSGIQSANNPEELEKVGSKMNSMISDIIVSVEAYPDLKASENFLSLQDELVGTENRIKWERDNFNEKVKEYRILIRRFPTNLIANMFRFNADKYSMFEAKEGADEAVAVNFD